MTRGILTCAVVALLGANVTFGADGVSSSVLKVDFRNLISRADLNYSQPATRSEEGQPIGNGRMGSLVWTTPSALHFQINRVDVFGQNSYTTSFPKQDSDYAGGCGYVDINVVDAGDDVFTGDAFQQQLSLYDALMTTRVNGLTARVLAWPQRDVIAVEIDDQRDQPAAINIDLRMLRYAIQNITGKNFELAKNHTVEIHTAEHTATSKLDIRDGRISLTQQFREADHYSASAIVIGIFGRASKARYLNETTVQISAAAGKGKFTVLIASAASFKPDEDVASLALKALEAAVPKGFAGLAADTQSWWHDFWSKGFVYMHSPDGQADFVEQNYTYFLYLMGASSRGAYPPRFGGMLWYTNGDMRRWGSQYWFANTNAYYSNLMPANRMELMEPMFNLYSGMLEACALAARQQWGSQGIWVPEITFFNGPEKLPDDIAAELQELLLVKKPYENRSARLQWWAETKNRHNSRWNFQDDGHWEHGHFVVPTKGAGIFGHCTHILSVAARIGNHFYQRYLFTQDKDWLRDRAYPIIKGSAEFYRNFPNVQKGDDGKYHIHHVNNGESSWDTSDTPNEIGGMRTAFSLAIRVSTILDVDPDLREKWQEMSDNLTAPGNPGRGRRPPRDAAAGAANRPATQPENLPAAAGANRQGSGRGGNRPFGAFVYGGPGAIPANEPEAQLKARFLGFNALGSFIDSKGIGGPQIFRNRMRLREGPGAIDAEHIGGLAAGIHTTLLDSTPADTGEPLIEVFGSAWPRSWDCAFQLLARGGFVVSSSVKDGKLEFVEVHSTLGGPCRLKNPWLKSDIDLYRNNTKSGSLTGDVVTFDTAKGESIVLVQASTTPEQIHRAILAEPKPPQAAVDYSKWRFFKPIRLNTAADGANVAGDVESFPVAVSLTANNFEFAAAKADGADVRFSSEKDGGPLAHSIEHWDQSGKTALVWVKVPMVRGNNASQSIVMHWGNSAAPKASNSHEVFATNDGFVGVWHLADEGTSDEGGYKDATSNAANGTGVNLKLSARVDGRVGRGVKLEHSQQQWIRIDSDKRKLFDLTNKLTFSIWAKASSFANKEQPGRQGLPGYETMFAKGDNSWRLQKFGIRSWHKPPAELLEMCVERAPRGDLCTIGKTDMALDQWYHFVGVHDHPKAKLYVNGVLDAEQTFDVPWKSDDHPVGIGNQSQFPQQGRSWDGVLDEARVINVPKNDHWIKLDYESQREGQKFLTFGKPEQRF